MKHDPLRRTAAVLVKMTPHEKKQIKKNAAVAKRRVATFMREKALASNG